MDIEYNKMRVFDEVPITKYIARHRLENTCGQAVSIIQAQRRGSWRASDEVIEDDLPEQSQVEVTKIGGVMCRVCVLLRTGAS